VDRKNLLIFIVGGVAVLFLFLFLVVLDTAKRGQDRIGKLEGEKTELSQQIDSLRGELKSAKETLAGLNKQVEGLNADKAKLQDQLTGANSERDGLKAEIEKLTAEISRARGETDAARTENSQLNEKLQSVSGKLSELEATVAELKAKKASLEGSLEKMQSQVKEKQQQLEELRSEGVKPQAQQPVQQTAAEGVKLSPIIVQGGQQKAPVQDKKPSGQKEKAGQREFLTAPPVIVGSAQQQKDEIRQEIAAQVQTIEKAAASIVAVNKESNFVILNQGSGQGIKIGDSFQVIDQDNRPAGEIEVIRVRDNIAAADIKKEIHPLRVGFIVR
jgi:chromosome segregation ATPase